MTVVNRSTSSLQQQIASSDMDRRTRAGRGAVSRIPAEADSGSLRAARSGPSPLLDPYPKTLGPAAPRRPGASPTGNIQLKCMSTGERDTSMVMAATGGGRRLPRSLMPTNVPRAEPAVGQQLVSAGLTVVVSRNARPIRIPGQVPQMVCAGRVSCLRQPFRLFADPIVIAPGVSCRGVGCTCDMEAVRPDQST